jgi:hypothetical protein
LSFFSRYLRWPYLNPQT